MQRQAGKCTGMQAGWRQRPSHEWHHSDICLSNCQHECSDRDNCCEVMSSLWPPGTGHASKHQAVAASSMARVAQASVHLSKELPPFDGAPRSPSLSAGVRVFHLRQRRASVERARGQRRHSHVRRSALGGGWHGGARRWHVGRAGGGGCASSAMETEGLGRRRSRVPRPQVGLPGVSDSRSHGWPWGEARIRPVASRRRGAGTESPASSSGMRYCSSV